MCAKGPYLMTDSYWEKCSVLGPAFILGSKCLGWSIVIYVGASMDAKFWRFMIPQGWMHKQSMGFIVGRVILVLHTNKKIKLHTAWPPRSKFPYVVRWFMSVLAVRPHILALLYGHIYTLVSILRMWMSEGAEQNMCCVLRSEWVYNAFNHFFF